jgi:hypothetical protein
MHARGSKSGVKNETPKLPEPREYLGKIGIFLLLNSNFPHTKFNFLQWLSDFQEIQEKSSSMVFRFLQRRFAFFNDFLLSSMAFQFSSMAFRFPRNTRKSIYGGKYTKDHYLSFVFPATCSPSFVILAN